MILPISKYSTTTIDGYDEPAIIYPAYFTLKQAAIVRFPPTCDTTQIKAYEPPLHAYDTLNNIQLDEFAYGFPSGFNLCPLPAPGPAGLPTISTAKPLDFRSAVTLHTPTTPLSYHIFPMTALPTPPTLPTSPLLLPFISPDAPTSSDQHTPRKVSTTLYNRSPANICRRYSLPFDKRTTGFRPNEPCQKVHVFSDSVAKGADFGFNFSGRCREQTQTRVKPKVEFGVAPYISPGRSVFEEDV